MISNMLPHEVLERLTDNDDVIIVDVREREEWVGGHIKGAKHIPLGQIARALNELDSKRETIVVCQSGGRSSMACEFLSSMGYNVLNMPGGMSKWPGDVVVGD